MRHSLAVAALSVLSAAPALSQSLVGVWKPVEVVVGSGPDAGRHTTDVQPGLLIVTPRFYSWTFVGAFAPRPDLPDSSTDEQRGRVYTPFTANAGTYRRADSTFSYTPLVAKNPSVMAGETYSMTVRVRADSAWFIVKAADGSENRAKWIRVEKSGRR